MIYSPKWSKAKKQLKSLICEPLRDRVDFHVINYRKAHDQLGRAVMTVDQAEILSMCTLTAIQAQAIREHSIRNFLHKDYDMEEVLENRDLYEQVDNQLKAECIFSQADFFTALDEYFHSSIDQCLQSENILLKVLGLLDRRLGKRKLRAMHPILLKEHEVVRFIYRLRCEAENVHLSSTD
ncbi:SF0329 family protein [Bacillus xiapuensis]|uniref:SF0329 family protein n=1 Tax=Bacillus xiapuensis TaxID=2014075 RepID=UPI000C232A5B|nr:hypothetical protein [Bacillus xiapuensis]